MKHMRLPVTSLSLSLLSLLVGGCSSSSNPVDAAVDANRADSGPADVPVADRSPVDTAVDVAQADSPPDAAPGPEALPRPDVIPPDVARVEAGPAVTMSFFITSTGSGAAGGNLGGLAGADMKCTELATAVGLGQKTWHAYLSTSAAAGAPAVNARDRIGTGPWYDYLGIQIAANLTELHGDALYLNVETALNEKGMLVPGRGTPADQGGNQHDILTGSQLDGTAFPASPDRTCANWTSSAAPTDAGAENPTAQVGHFDRGGGGQNPQSWNSAHATPGCNQASLVQVGGAGRLYCFAIN
jgi:hypothetical protein